MAVFSSDGSLQLYRGSKEARGEVKELGWSLPSASGAFEGSHKDNGQTWSPTRVLEMKDYRIPHPGANSRSVRLTFQEAFDNAERREETFSYRQFLVGPDLVFVRSRMLKVTMHRELVIDWGARL